MPENSKIYITDLDGTLLNDKGDLSAHTREKFRAILDAGINLTIASARSLKSIQEKMGDMPVKLPVIGFNGGVISDLHTGEHFHVNSFSSEKAKKLLAMIKSQKLLPFLSAISKGEDKLFWKDILNPGMEFYIQDRKSNHDPRLTKIDSLESVMDDVIITFNTVGKEDDIFQLKNMLKNEFKDGISINYFENLYSPGWFWATIQDGKANKANAIHTLLADHGFVKENLTVFGDHGNDIPMFLMAGTSIAVGNALDKVKDHASQIIGTNEENSVVQYICKENGLQD